MADVEWKIAFCAIRHFHITHNAPYNASEDEGGPRLRSKLKESIPST